MERKVTVYMMLGLPGAGKSTWARKNHPELDIIDFDEVAIELGALKPNEKSIVDDRKMEMVKLAFREKIKEHAEIGKDFVIDAMNMFESSRNKIKELLRGFNIYWIYVWIKSPNLETNMMRRQGQVSKKAIIRMSKQFQAPLENEYNELMQVKQIRDKEIIEIKQGTYETRD